MFLKSIYVKNFRSIAEASIDFEHLDSEKIRKWTFFLGENGMGKSNLLKAIALVTAGSDSIGELLGNVDDWIRYKTDLCEIRAQLVTSRGEERKLELKLRRGASISKVIKEAEEGLSEIDDALEHTQRNYFVVGYGANRKLASRTQPGAANRLYHSDRSNSIATMFNRNAAMHSLDEWAVNIDYQTKGKGLTAIKKILNNFLPSVVFDHIDRKSGSIIFKTKDGLVPLELLSDGYQNMASLLGDILYRLSHVFEDRKDPLKSRGLILIDEIELHLHPVWQKKLIAFLSRTLPNFQFICTTHSPLTVQQADEGELYLLTRRRGGKVKVEQFEGAPKYMPLNDLVVSPIFGLDTDESVELTKKKKKLEKLEEKSHLTRSDTRRMKSLKEELMGRPISFKNDLTTQQMELLKQLKKKL